jgi:hypothetical protein
LEANENITLSLKDHLATKLTAMGYQTVYYIQDMRNVASGTALPTDKRYVFLTSTFLKPTMTTLPFVVLEVQDIDRIPWQLGDDGEGRVFNVFVHVFGRSQSERNQVSSYLQGTNGIGRSITYNDYSGSAPVANAYAIQRTSGIMVSNAPPVRNEQITEQSLANWNIVSFEARTIA